MHVDSIILTKDVGVEIEIESIETVLVRICLFLAC